MSKKTWLGMGVIVVVTISFTMSSFVNAQFGLLGRATSDIDARFGEKSGEIELDSQDSKLEITDCGEPIVDRDGYVYETVAIGSQCWMAGNLKTKTNVDGTCINGGKAPCPNASAADNGKGRACYNNDESLCLKEGALYTFAGMGGTINQAGVQGICPDGWHIPTHNELTTLERSVCTSGTCASDFPYDLTTYGPRGTNEAFSLLTGGASGFNAVLTGRREADGTTFTNRGVYTWLWSSQYGLPSVYRRLITASSGQIFRDAGNLSFNRSQSLRCVRDVPVKVSCGESVTDRDGFTYGTVTIGDKCWLSENLKTRTNPDGTCINQGMTSTVNGHHYTVGPAPDCKIYDNGVATNLGGYTVNQAITSGRDCISQTQSLQGTESDCVAGSALYSWPAALGHTATNPIIPTPGYQSLSRQGICPTGWHIPTWDEYTALERSVCTSGTCATDFPYDLTTTGDRGTNEGAYLRVGGNSGFSALPIGQRRPHPTDTTQPAVFYKDPHTFLWTTAYNGDFNQAGRRIMYGNNDTVNRKYTYIYAGYGVRCVKD